MANSKAGFTIIEVMIVLVIAAVILLIVFLAVPALNRNKRNYQRRNDVSILLAMLGETAGNSGELPYASCNNLMSGCWVNEAKLGFYDNAEDADTNNISYLHRDTPWSSDPAEIQHDEIPDTEPAVSTYEVADSHGYPYNRVSIRTYTRCDPNNIGHFTRDNAIASSIAAQFLIETGTGYQLQCYES